MKRTFKVWKVDYDYILTNEDGKRELMSGTMSVFANNEEEAKKDAKRELKSMKLDRAEVAGIKYEGLREYTMPDHVFRDFCLLHEGCEVKDFKIE